MVDKTNYKEHILFFLMCVLCILGVISGLGAINYGVANGILYIVAGITGIGLSVYTIITSYKRFNQNTSNVIKNQNVHFGSVDTIIKYDKTENSENTSFTNEEVENEFKSE